MTLLSLYRTHPLPDVAIGEESAPAEIARVTLEARKPRTIPGYQVWLTLAAIIAWALLVLSGCRAEPAPLCELPNDAAAIDAAVTAVSRECGPVPPWSISYDLAARQLVANCDRPHPVGRVRVPAARGQEAQ